jgi:hypothetical protein
MKCTLCARRGRTTDAESHVCVPCAAWLQVQVADIARLAADAAAFVAPGSSTGGGSRPVPGSRPPLLVDALDPELTPVGPPPSPTVLEVVESWERMIRDERGMAPYGPASQARTPQILATSAVHGLAYSDRYNETRINLIGCTSFLGAQVAWMTTEPDFPIEDFADEIVACVRVLRRWDVTAEERGTMVRCPTLLDAGECGYRLSYRDWDEHVTCKRCGQSRDASTLALLAMSDGREVWLDPEAAARYLCISEGHLRKLAKKGHIQRDHGRYLVSNLDFSA